MKALTIITPSYNRTHTLTACYNSLKNQTSKDFIWLVVDDGSTDNTEKLVKRFINENTIEIQYIKKENGGKASALNVAINKLATKYAVCLDSDDVFFQNTVELAINNLNETKNNPRCCGILALRHGKDGFVMGKREIPLEMKYITAKDVFLKLNLNTELICFYKTKILKKYRFPEFPGEKFVSPAWMQYEITQKYVFRTSWDKLCQCEYISDGLTKNKRAVIKKNPQGYTAVKKYSFDLAPNLRLRIKHGIMYDCGCLLGKEKEWLRNSKYPVLSVLLMPVAMAVKKLRFNK